MTCVSDDVSEPSYWSLSSRNVSRPRPFARTPDERLVTSLVRVTGTEVGPELEVAEQTRPVVSLFLEGPKSH